MNRNKPRYWLEKRSRVRTDYPMATVIYYEPTADFASKVVVGIVPSNRDRILGCPHEEGPDYPEGEVCPQCPYWANRDRFTGELISETAE